MQTPPTPLTSPNRPLNPWKVGINFLCFFFNDILQIVPNGALIAHHFTVAMQRQKDASISPADQTGEAANMHEVEHTQATADIYYGPSAQGRD